MTICHSFVRTHITRLRKNACYTFVDIILFANQIKKLGSDSCSGYKGKQRRYIHIYALFHFVPQQVRDTCNIFQLLGLNMHKIENINDNGDDKGITLA